MRFLLNVIIFLAFTIFCFYWFNDGNPKRDDPSEIPYIGSLFEVISDEYVKMDFYLRSSQGNFFDYLSNNESVREIKSLLKEIYVIADYRG